MTPLIVIVGFLGAGKTTLLRCLCGMESADKGNIVFRKEQRVSWMEQTEDFDPNATVWDLIADNQHENHQLFYAYNQALENNDTAEIDR